MSDLIRVQVPASTSNLGSGFDTVSAALSLYLSVEVETASNSWVWLEGWDHSSQENILETALRLALQALNVGVPGLRFRMHNSIPLQRGLGSSGAAIVAGIKIAERLAGRSLNRGQIFELALPLEGHPDNLAASLLGGWVLSRVDNGHMFAETIQAALSCRFVVAVPSLTISTRVARDILPGNYPLADAVFNLQRCALLVHALHSGRKELLWEATRDRLHQPYRAALVPGLPELLDLDGLESELRASLLGLCISGSGSSVVSLVDGRAEAVGDWMKSVFAAHGTTVEIQVLDLDCQGARVS